MTRVLVVGKDGRTDALADALARDGARVVALCDFRHPGLLRRAAEFRQGRTDDPATVTAVARETRAELVVIGPEDPLAAGVVDELQRGGIPCVGPTRALARLETSKSFTRSLQVRHGIPGLVEHRVFRSTDGLADYLRERAAEGGFAVKPDGLTGGKGVRVSGDHLVSVDEGLAYAGTLLERDGLVLVEEKLDGEEFSLQSLSDGETVVDLPPVQDHKRAFEGDRGPNTGGMGSYSSEDHRLPFLDAADLAEARRINHRMARAVAEECGMPYRGVLYGGFMLTARGVRLIEYNARFGDPEALNVLPLLDRGFLAICQGVAGGGLTRVPVQCQPRATVCKYLVPACYPTSAELRGQPVQVVPGSEGEDVLRVYYAAVEERDGAVLLTGSRALAVVGLGTTLSEAEAMAERAAARVKGPVRHRRDIGTPALVGQRVDHVRRLRGWAGRP